MKINAPFTREGQLPLGPTLFLVCLLCGPLAAQHSPWRHADGTTHWYEAVAAPAGITWDDANLAALQARGHLASVTSLEESAFVFALVDDPALWATSPSGTLAGPWIGGVQPPGAPEPAGGWLWTDGEPLAFTNWTPGQPDNLGGDEDRIHFGGTAGTRTPGWADDSRSSSFIIGYVIEWDWAPDQTVGLHFNHPGASGGLTLFSSPRAPPPTGATQYDQVVLMDMTGRVVNSWHSTHDVGYTSYLLDNGDILRAVKASSSSWAGGVSGRVEQFSWSGALIWEFTYDSPDHVTHHDIARLPNGNVLMIVWERKLAADAIAAGRDPALLPNGVLWPLAVIEVAPSGLSGGTIVWEWHVWDHLIQDHDAAMGNFGIVADHPELVDVNFHTRPNADWLHTNAIDYNPQLDQILLSIHHLNEVWVIDHSTTTTQAAGHAGGLSNRGGDLLYRWGNPQAYRAGTAADQRLHGQHDAEWIDPGLPGAGNILIFNNGLDLLPDPYSSIVEFTPPVDVSGHYVLVSGQSFGPQNTAWTYSAPNRADFYSAFVSSSQRLPGGNTLICSGAEGIIFEVTPGGEEVWRYVNPMSSLGLIGQGESALLCCNEMFRAERYLPTHPGLSGRDLTPGDPIEGYPLEILARFGSVNAGSGARTDVLKVDGSAGDIWREVWVNPSQQVSLTIDASPPGPVAANFVLFAMPFEAGLPDVTVQPANLGISSMPLLALPPGTASFQFTAASSFLAPLVTGTPALPIIPLAPATILQGSLPPGTLTIQGYIEDAGAQSSGLSVTNAIVLNIL